MAILVPAGVLNYAYSASEGASGAVRRGLPTEVILAVLKWASPAGLAQAIECGLLRVDLDV